MERESIRVFAPGPTGKQFGQASTLDKFMTALAELIQDRANYYIKLFVLRASDWMPFDESITIAP